MISELFFRTSLKKHRFMKFLKHTFYTIIFTLFIIGCGAHPIKSNSTSQEEPVIIANEALAYEIIIMDVGFTSYLNAIAKPMQYHSKTYLQSKNRVYVAIWNNRARNPTVYNMSIYENIIEYEPNTDYGLEVNYKLYWYFKFAEQKYKMRLNY